MCLLVAYAFWVPLIVLLRFEWTLRPHLAHPYQYICPLSGVLDPNPAL